METSCFTTKYEMKAEPNNGEYALYYDSQQQQLQKINIIYIYRYISTQCKNSNISCLRLVHVNVCVCILYNVYVYAMGCVGIWIIMGFLNLLSILMAGAWVECHKIWELQHQNEACHTVHLSITICIASSFCRFSFIFMNIRNANDFLTRHWRSFILVFFKSLI